MRGPPTHATRGGRQNGRRRGQERRSVRWWCMDSPSSPDLLGYTSDRLAALHLDDPNNTSVDDMDTDLVLEVSDTPDRMAAAAAAAADSADGTPSSAGDGGSGGSGGAAMNDGKHMLRRARLRHLISQTLDSKSSAEASRSKAGVSNGSRRNGELVELDGRSPFPLYHPTRCRDSRRRSGKAPGLSFDGQEAGLKWGDKGKGIALSSDPQAKTEGEILRPLHLDAWKLGWRHLGSNRSLSRCSTMRSSVKSKVDGQDVIKLDGGETCSSSAGLSDQDNGKGVDLRGYRRNATQGKNVAGDGAGKTVGELLGGETSDHINLVSSESEASHADKKKGKLKSEDTTSGSMQRVKTKTRSGRFCSASNKEVTIISDADDTPTPSEDLGWRTKRNRTGKVSTYSLHKIAGTSKREDIDNLFDQDHEIIVGDRENLVNDSPEIVVSHHELNPSRGHTSSESDLESRRYKRRQKFMKGMRKCNFLRSSSGESSSSFFEDSEISHHQSFGQSSNSKSPRTLHSQHRGTMLEPVEEVDELHSPEVRCISPQRSCRLDDSSAKARQVESDEIFARQLQQQFYHESSEFGGTEVDATIAWTLQEEEDAQRAASIVRRGQSHPSDASIAHLYAHYPRPLLQNDSARLTRARVPTLSRVPRLRNFNSPEVDLESTMLAHLRHFNSAVMDGEARLNILEALEAAFDSSNENSNNFLQIQRDFNEDDYEMLLTLDENNDQHVGASESQINSLPQSVIQSDSIEEACAVCLETPSVGDIIRHLPCLHKFHKDCIDKWLRRKTTCPICKSSII